MDPTKVWPEIDKWLNYVKSWITYAIGFVFPVVLALLMLKGTRVGLFVGDYVPQPSSDYLVWLYLAGIWYLIRK